MYFDDIFNDNTNFWRVEKTLNTDTNVETWKRKKSKRRIKRIKAHRCPSPKKTDDFFK